MSRPSTSCRLCQPPAHRQRAPPHPSRSTARSALWARWVRPSFICVTRASGACGWVHSAFEFLFLRDRSNRATSARVGVGMPDASASRVKERRVAGCGESRGSGWPSARSNPYTERPWRWAGDRRRAKRRRCGWIQRSFRRATVIPFFERLNRSWGIAGSTVERLRAAFYANRLGRPGLRPGRYLRMPFIGYFEGLSSERGIAWRVADSLNLRSFLDLAVDRGGAGSLPAVAHAAADRRDWRRVWFVGRPVGIDATTLEANAAMRSIERRDTGESSISTRLSASTEAASWSRKWSATTTSQRSWHRAAQALVTPPSLDAPPIRPRRRAINPHPSGYRKAVFQVVATRRPDGRRSRRS